MMNYSGGGFVKWFFLSLLLCQVLSMPKTIPDENPLKEIFGEGKRDTSSLGGGPVHPLLKTSPFVGGPVVPLMKSPLFNPYFMYPPFAPAKSFLFPPMTPSDIFLNRFAKATSAGPPLDPTSPSLMSAYFKAKKDEFLTKLFEKLSNDTMVSSLSARSVTMLDDSDPTKPPIDSSYFFKKKYEFLETLFKTLNITAQPNATDAQAVNATEATTVTTPKPTIVPADFWFPFAKLPKPTKAPKPTKPPKVKKILKDALDTMLLQSLLLDMGVDPKDASLSKRRIARTVALPKKTKSKKIKPEEELTEFNIPPKVDSTMYSSKTSACLDKLFNILSKPYDEDLDSSVYSKGSVTPTNLWTQPSKTKYTSSLDAILDILIKSLNATDFSPENSGKPEKSFKGKPGKKMRKRSTFLDELLHRVTTTPSPTTTTEPTLPLEDLSILDDPDCDFAKILNPCCCDEKCVESPEGKSLRSLVFKPFGSGYWIPQYLYAAKMTMYLDKLMDTINMAAASEVESESAATDGLKRSVPADDADTSGMAPKDAALNLIISELTDLKNGIVDAFAEGIKAQKDATPTQKPFSPAAKSFKKPFWGPKALPTTDPVVPIQKRIDILNDVFDKLTKVEKTLIFTEKPEYDPKAIANLTEILQTSFSKLKSDKSKTSTKLTSKSETVDTNSPEFYLTKTREYLKSLYSSKTDDSDDTNI